jgi:hypothetical protein
VRAVPFPEFERWYDATANEIQRARDDAAKQRQQLQQAQ